MTLKYEWSPWPESRARKIQIAEHVPQSDVVQRRGWQHTRWRDPRKLEEDQQAMMLQAIPVDLKALTCDSTADECKLHAQFHDAVDFASVWDVLKL